MRFTFYGHACFGIELGGTNLLIDPFISPNPKASHIDVSAIKADYILVTHGHQDHVADVETIAKANGSTIVSNFEIVSWFEGKGLNGHPMNHGGGWNFDFGRVQYVNAIHSSVLPDGSYGGNPGGFVVTTSEGCFYHAGDTALTLDMQLIGKGNNLDVALLPVGDNFTMGYNDAIEAAKMVQCTKVIGMHFDTFGFIEIDHAAAKQAFADAGLELILPNIGDTIDL